MDTESTANEFDQFEQERSVQIDFDGLSRGIDNYHIDIKLSQRFIVDVKKLAHLLVSQLAVPNPKRWDNSRPFDKFREKYLDLMTVLIHRVKTDLKPDEVCLLQFATIKHILTAVRSQVDHDIRAVSGKLSEHRNKGSAEALATQQRLFWLKKNYDSILYEVNRQIFAQLQRVEERQLATVRDQYLGESYQFIVEIILNPLLYTADLSALPLLLNEYSVWSWNGQDAGFIDVNSKLEKLLEKRFPEHPVQALKQTEGLDNSASEIHDELGGLFRSQPFLGIAADTQTQIGEEFCWFDLPESVKTLFDRRRNQDQLAALKTLSFRERWERNRELNRRRRILKAFARLLRSEKVLTQLVATHYMRRNLSQAILEHVDLKVLCQYLSGNIPMNKLLESITGSGSLNTEQKKSLETLRETIRSQVARADQGDLLRLLLDISQYRHQLKLFRFAHRAFNRIKLLSDEADLKLSRSAGTMYQLPTSSEVEADDDRIVHHAILKADVRGSTTVTDELENKGLNPASYFSLRFFNPINKILETYGANKVFIEGDAIILSFLEYENSPQQWYAVSRACGCAKDMLKITGSNNRYSNQMGLPLLELGIGICYSNSSPHFLYDGEHPIMISPTIGLADRMSGCSWKLRAAIKKGLFNVDVLRIADGENGRGEKGQDYARYNVNGIVLDDCAFAKLRKEIPLRSLRMKLNGKNYLFHIGQYPDAKGRKKDLVIREGTAGVWKDSEVHLDPDATEKYYEVVVNRKVLPLVLESMSRNQTAAVG